MDIETSFKWNETFKYTHLDLYLQYFFWTLERFTWIILKGDTGRILRIYSVRMENNFVKYKWDF